MRLPMIAAAALGVILALGGFPAARSSTHPLPAQVESYYEDVNFVASFSSPEERRILRAAPISAFLGQPERSELGGRLPEVYRRMERTRQVFHRIDPGIVRPAPPMDDGMILAPNALSAGVFDAKRTLVEILPELFEVVKVRLSPAGPGRILVTVLVHQVSLNENRLWIAEYREDEEGPAPGDRIASLERPRTRTEVHRWRLDDGRWLLDESHLVYLAD